MRSISAKSLGSLTRGLGEATFPDLRPWLIDTLRSEGGNSVERSGAAQGLSELSPMPWWCRRKWERVPLGLNLLTNDSSLLLKVIDLPRGTQARVVAQANQLDPNLF